MDSVSEKNTHPIPWWRGIRGRLVLFSIIILALSLIIFNLFSIRMFKSHLFRTGREKNLDLAQKITEEIETSMEGIVLDLFSVSRIWPIEGESLSDRRAELERLKERNENIRILSISDIQGNKLLSVSEKDTVSVDQFIDKAQGDKIESIIKGNIHISHVYPVTQTLPLVDVSVPLRSIEQGKVRGVLTAVITLRGVYEKLEAIKLKKNQELYLVDKNGLMIANFSHMKEQKVLGLKGLIPFWANSGFIKNFKQYMPDISERDLITPPIYKNLDQQDVLGVISICPKLKWGVIVEEPVNVLLEPMAPIIKKNILITSLIFIIASFLIILLVGLILSPLIQNKHLRYRYKELGAINQVFEDSDVQSGEVTEKIEFSQANLRKEKSFAEKLIDSVDFLIVVLDLSGKVLICNRSCEKKTGYNLQEIIGKNWFETVYPSGVKSAAIERFHKRVRLGDAPDVIEDYILTKDRESLNMEWHITIINDSKGMAEGVTLVGEDVTFKRKIEEELKTENIQLLKNNDELENILSIVSHDLKNPLYILQDFASILLQEYKGSLSEDGLYYLERIKANAQHMERLILDLLELSRVSRAKGIWHECAISDLVQKALEEFRQPIKNKGIEVRILDNFPICFCESERIFQVFMNLLSNAIKFIQDTENPIVEIGYLETQEEHKFFVRDNGIGIEKEYHDKIFVIFQRLQDVRDVEGSGVGLTIVKKIVEGHGGKVWVESKKGKGATFYFTIPKKIPNPEVHYKINQTPKIS